MENRQTLKIGFLVNVVLGLLGIGILYFSSLFWIGSKEDYEEIVTNKYWSFFASRLMFNVIVGLVLLIIIGIINWILLRILKHGFNIKKLLLIDLLLFIISSAIFVFIQLS